MTRRELASLCVRLLAIITIINAIRVLGSVIPFLVQSVNDLDLAGGNGFFISMIFSSAIGPGLLLVAGIFLWKKAGTIAAMITGQDLQDEPDEPDVIRIDARLFDVHAVAFSILGLWILLRVIPLTARLVSTIAFSGSPPSGVGWPEFFIRSASTGILTLVPQLILGIWLLLGARGLVSILHRLRGIVLQPNEILASGGGKDENAGDDQEHGDAT